MNAKEKVAAVSPLGADVMLEVGTPDHQLCCKWSRFTHGFVDDDDDDEDIRDWFVEWHAGVSPGLYAELLCDTSRHAEFEAFVSEHGAAAEHILALEIQLSNQFMRAKIEQAQDIVRVVRARAAARRAVMEISHGC